MCKYNTNFDYNYEVKIGNNRLIQRLVKYVIENILEGEMEEHLGRNKYGRKESSYDLKKNYRNGYNTKNL